MPYIRSCLVQLLLVSNLLRLRNHFCILIYVMPLSWASLIWCVVPLLWDEVFRLLNLTARLFPSILMFQSTVVLFFSLANRRKNPVLLLFNVPSLRLSRISIPQLRVSQLTGIGKALLCQSAR
jgi:hypothetical protein